MDEQTTKLLMKKVKKHKKWTEEVFVNPVYWEVNGKPYYMGGYLKNEESVGTAFLTIGDEVKEEAMEAQKWLPLFGDISSSILQTADARMNIRNGYFLKPLGIAVLTDDEKVQQGREAFAQLWKTHQDFIRLAKEYTHYYNEDVLVRGLITEPDVRFTQEQANLATMYQYRTLNALVEWNEEIRAFVAYLKKTDGFKELSKDGREFAEGITENKDKLQKNLEALDLITNEDPEKMIQLNLERHKKRNEEQIAAQRKYVRYPK